VKLIFPLLVILVSATYCASTSNNTNNKTALSDDAPEEIGQFVLVRPDSLFYSAPDKSATNFKIKNEEDKDADNAYVFRLISLTKQWAEIQPVSVKSSKNCCARAPYEFDGMLLTLFVLKEDLEPVITKKTKYEFSDGTSVELLPGVQVSPDADQDGWRKIVLNNLSFLLKLQADQTGYSYNPQKMFETTRDQQQKNLGYIEGEAFLKSRVYIAESRTIGKEEPAYVVVRAVNNSPINIKTRNPSLHEDIFQIQKINNQYLVELRRSCARIQAKIDQEDFRQGIINRSGYRVSGLITKLLNGKQTKVSVLPNKELYWRDGKLAGLTTQDVIFWNESAPAGDRRCFQKTLNFTKPTQQLELCVDPNSLPLIE
jgi:hypothetical protein